ncbi:MAG TPA: hypothetical protein VFU23_08320 [Gemmatimonadales bacterium]|nr:hypothetical protein [Gemmatimonadales bacterium]
MSRTVRLALLTLFLAAPGRLAGQSLTWSTLATLYGDNTEFFTPYRVGETILGGQFRSTLEFRTGRRTAFELGAFGDHRSGDDEFLATIKPIIRFRYHAGGSTGVLGTLYPERRHGLLEPLQVTTLEITRPIEYGLQWIERRRRWDGEIYMNWQKLNTPEQREAFDYGWVFRVRPLRVLSLESQLHGVHHGGQLFDAGVPVTNNVASGLGAVVSDSLPWLGRSSIGAYRLRSSGNADPSAPPGRPGKGHGWYVRAAVAPGEWFELFSISWWGRDFLSQEGDNNYNSVGADPAFYRSRRKYWEIGLLRRTTIDGAVTFDGEFRLHRIDHLKSIALGKSRWEYSYRLMVRAPFDLPLKS